MKFINNELAKKALASYRITITKFKYKTQRYKYNFLIFTVVVAWVGYNKQHEVIGIQVKVDVTNYEVISKVIFGNRVTNKKSKLGFKQWKIRKLYILTSPEEGIKK